MYIDYSVGNRCTERPCRQSHGFKEQVCLVLQYNECLGRCEILAGLRLQLETAHCWTPTGRTNASLRSYSSDLYVKVLFGPVIYRTKQNLQCKFGPSTFILIRNDLYVCKVRNSTPNPATTVSFTAMSISQEHLLCQSPA